MMRDSTRDARRTAPSRLRLSRRSFTGMPASGRFADARLPVVSVDYPAWVADVVDHDRRFADDDAKMRLAITLSRENVERGTGGPFGAAVFERDTGRLVAVGMNSVVR